MAKLNLNGISNSVFKVSASENLENSEARAKLVGAGRVLFYDHAARGQKALYSALNKADATATPRLSADQYKELNEKFQVEHMLYAADKVCQYTGQASPRSWEDFKRNSAAFYGNDQFYKVLSGIWQEVLQPILPRVYSEAVSVFADVVEVDFGETYALSIGSNDIPVFQDTSWGAQRSVPRNRFYSKDITLNPKPRSAWITAKWFQLLGSGMDFGKFFANITAGMYAKTMGLWNQTMVAAASNTAMIPTGLKTTFSNTNWVNLANKISSENNTPISNLVAVGNAVALSKVLPTNVTGSTNVNMDAAIATMLGADYTRMGYLGEFMSVRLMPLIDVVVPGTQNGNVTTMLDSTKVWIMAGNGYKPMTIAYNSATPLTLEMDPTKTGDFEIGINLTIAMDAAAVFASKVGLVTVP